MCVVKESKFEWGEYDSSFDWIMPVLQRIEHLGYDTIIPCDHPNPLATTIVYQCEIYKGDISFSTLPSISRLEAINEVILKFIEFYNLSI